jgi:hypothetical protein
MKEQNIIGKILSGFDGMPSSKRTLMLWIGIVLWSFVHVMVFFLIRPFSTDIASTVILYDVILILSLGGMNVSERIWGKGKDASEPEKPAQ